MSEYQKARDQIPERNNGPRCGVAIVLDRLDPKSRADVLADLALDSGVQGTRIARSLKAMDVGFDYDRQVVQKHRRGDCKCPR